MTCHNGMCKIDFDKIIEDYIKDLGLRYKLEPMDWWHAGDNPMPEQGEARYIIMEYVSMTWHLTAVNRRDKIEVRRTIKRIREFMDAVRFANLEDILK